MLIYFLLLCYPSYCSSASYTSRFSFLHQLCFPGARHLPRTYCELSSSSPQVLQLTFSTKSILQRYLFGQCPVGRPNAIRTFFLLICRSYSVFGSSWTPMKTRDSLSPGECLKCVCVCPSNFTVLLLIQYIVSHVGFGQTNSQLKSAYIYMVLHEVIFY